MFEPDENVVSFGIGLTSQNRSDISALLQQADRFASHAYDRNVHWQAWLDYYDSRLKKHGCNRLSTITSQPLFVSDMRDVDEVKLDIASFDDPQKLFDLARRVMAALGLHDFVRAWLKGNGKGDARMLSWVVVPCELNARGEIVLTTFGVQVRGLPLSTQQKPEVVIRMSGGVYIFQPEVYERFRTPIREELKGIALRRLVQMRI
ncbi:MULTISPECIES: hypothetical protein [Pseudomonas]|uniref:Uncharacterized protein n=1 Tax=Pseudomonas eucalypticola TaxID=2599595 RepID=A0A7D5HB10_9PSED|nr:MULTISPECIES: hypothetical protein [Pseudomonas]QKZ02850.1 hypothetical protein HWQ56_03140 [Pseudomonas eucalypticola]